MSDSGKSEMIRPNELETQRFGVSFGRFDATGTPSNIASAIREADCSNIKVLSTRIESTDHKLVGLLEDLGFRLMDTLVYYRRTLPFTRTVMHGNHFDLSIIGLGASNAEACATIARASFHNYRGHYHTDPRLSNDAADAAYADWAARLVRDPMAGSIMLGAAIDTKVLGFIVGLPTEENGSEIVLNAVHPDAQRHGRYSALLESYLEKATARGDRSVMISTQLQNYPVQRAWSRAGFVLFKSFHTLHRWSSAV